MTEEESLEETIARAAEWRDRERPRAGFFAWPDRQLAERGVARTFAEAAASEPGFPLKEIASPDRDPPDCVATDAAGGLIALEVTELVDGAANALAKADRARVVLAPWDCDKFARVLRDRLQAKDNVKLQGGPYSEYIVLVHTDEPMLTPDHVATCLRAVNLGPFRQIDRAYLILSYQPGVQGYPYFKLDS